MALIRGIAPLFAALAAWALLGRAAAAGTHESEPTLSAPLAARAGENGGADPATLPVEQFFRLWEAGDCSQLGSMLDDSFTYTVPDYINLTNTPITASKDDFLAGYCKQWARKFATNMSVAGSLGAYSYATMDGYDALPSPTGAALPCLVPFPTAVSALVDAATGALTAVWEGFDAAAYAVQAKRCTDGVPLPSPSDDPAAVSVASFASQWLQLALSGQIDDMAALITEDCVMLDGLSAKPISGRDAVAQAVKQAYETSPCPFMTRSALQDGDTAFLTGRTACVFMDPVAKAPCAVWLEQVATVTVVQEAAKLRVKEVTLQFDEAQYAAATKSKCHQ